MQDYYILSSEHTDPARLRREREKARQLRKSPWWNQQTQRGICHYCEGRFPPAQLTLDHVVPLARGGTSTRGNCVPACRKCNQEKKLETPVERLLRELEAQK
jgi:5-methylcytosine-specific restriction protein A